MITDSPDERYDLDEPYPVTMTDLFGSDVTIGVTRLDVTSSEGAASEVVLFGLVTRDALLAAARHGAFHVDDDELHAGWEADAAVEVVLRLRHAVAASFAGGDQLLQTLVGDKPTPLRHTESWFLLEATQPVEVPDDPDAAVGYGIQTRWAD